jgi:hypothetical protein
MTLEEAQKSLDAIEKYCEEYRKDMAEPFPIGFPSANEKENLRWRNLGKTISLASEAIPILVPQFAKIAVESIKAHREHMESERKLIFLTKVLLVATFVLAVIALPPAIESLCKWNYGNQPARAITQQEQGNPGENTPDKFNNRVMNEVQH